MSIIRVPIKKVVLCCQSCRQYVKDLMSLGVSSFLRCKGTTIIFGRCAVLCSSRKSSPVPFFTLKEGAPPPPRLPLLRRGLQPVNREFGTRKQAHAPKGVARDCLRNRVAIV